MADEETTRAVVTNPPDNQADPMLYRMVVAGLIATILITLVGGIALTALDKALSDGLIAIGAGAIGALAGLLAPAPAR